MQKIKTDQPKASNKKVIFDDDGEIVSEEVIKNKRTSAKETNGHKQKNRKTRTTNLNSISKYSRNDTEEIELKWFEVYQNYNTNAEPLELKDREATELRNLCKNSFDSELFHFKKKNPSDAKWLETALHTGTSKDRANAGALLVTSNPLGNTKALETLIGLSKLSNKSSVDVISIITDLFIESLLPNHRKLISVALRGSDWKALQKQENLTKEDKEKIYAYWHYEGELKELYFEYLKNLQHAVQTGQDANKNVSIIAASKLLIYAPEKEPMLLSMLINKLGDPSTAVASKALHHLSEVAYKHPNMCGVITNETEKLLFRNNIGERAQHLALCFLAQLAHSGRSDVCTKLVNICFSFFKVLVHRGAINNKTMQAILRCLQKAIVDAKPPADSTEIMTKDMQDTIYRLVHLADIQISIQTLSLLLQLIAVKSEKPDRFYNALYRKLLDLNLTNVGYNSASQFFHIVHRAIHIDQNVPRAQAFIKRLLQMALYMPAQMVCGCLIVINKILKLRPELLNVEERHEIINSATEEELARFDSDGEEKYEDIRLEDDRISENENKEKEDDKVNHQGSSWYHAKNIVKIEKEKVSEMSATKYDPYYRVPAFAGAEFAMKAELLILKEHFHPTVKVFAESILSKKKIDYYGDPLRDFSLTHFLERFAFKNPKKLDEKKQETPTQIIHSKTYTPSGTRGKPVSTLTKTHCTEEELFIFNYLENKRKNQVVKKVKDDDDVESVDDDEFEDYLDTLCKKSKHTDNDDDDADDVNYLKELSGDLSLTLEKKKKKKSKDDEDDEGNEIDDDWGDDDVNSDEDNFDDELDSDEDGSISLDEDENDDDMESSLENYSSSGEDEPKTKKRKKMSGKNLEKSLKNKNDVSSLFAAADDFAELLEETGKVRGHGTSNAVSNKDKSSEKQLKWEEQRRSTFSRKFKSKKKFGKFSGGNKNKRKV